MFPLPLNPRSCSKLSASGILAPGDLAAGDAAILPWTSGPRRAGRHENNRALAPHRGLAVFGGKLVRVKRPVTRAKAAGSGSWIVRLRWGLRDVGGYTAWNLEGRRPVLGWPRRDGVWAGRRGNWRLGGAARRALIEQGVKPLDSVDGARLLADLTGVDVVWLLGLDETGSGWRPTQPPAGPAAGPAVADTVEASAKEWETMLRRTFVLGAAAALSTAAAAGSLFDAERSVDGRRHVAPEVVADMATVAEKYRRSYRYAPASKLLPLAHGTWSWRCHWAPPGNLRPCARRWSPSPARWRHWRG